MDRKVENGGFNTDAVSIFHPQLAIQCRNEHVSEDNPKKIIEIDLIMK